MATVRLAVMLSAGSFVGVLFPIGISSGSRASLVVHVVAVDGIVVIRIPSNVNFAVIVRVVIFWKGGKNQNVVGRCCALKRLSLGPDGL